MVAGTVRPGSPWRSTGLPNMEVGMAWTLLLLLTVAWLLTLLVGTGPPWSWLLPAAIGALLLYRMILTLRPD